VTLSASNRKTEHEAESEADISREEWELLELISRPFVYTLTYAKKALHFKPPDVEPEDAIVNRELHEIHRDSNDAFFPNLLISKNRGRVRMLLFLYNLHEERRYDVLYHDKQILVYVSGKSIGMYTIPVYAFPPSNLESYLFLYLNPQIRKIISEYLERHHFELPEEFISSVEEYITYEDSLGNTHELPNGNFFPRGVNGLEFTVWEFSDRRLKSFIARYEVKISSTIETFTMKFADKDKDWKILTVQAFGIDSLKYTAPRLGLEDDIKKVLADLAEVYRGASRGALYFHARRKMEKI